MGFFGKKKEETVASTDYAMSDAGSEYSDTSSAYSDDSSSYASSSSASSSATSASNGTSNSSYADSSDGSDYYTQKQRQQRVKELPCVAPSTLRTIILVTAMTLAAVAALGWSTASDNSDRIARLESTNGTASIGPQVAALQNKVAALESANVALEAARTALEAANTLLQGRVTALEAPLEAWHSTGLSVNWNNGANVYESTGIQFRRDATFVYMRGGTTAPGSNANSIICTLPSGYRPTSKVSFKLPAAYTVTVTITIATNGQVTTTAASCGIDGCEGLVLGFSGTQFAHA